MRNKTLTAFIISIIFFLVPQITLAGIIEVDLKPTIPGPHEEVTASLVGFTVDLDKSTMVWYIDGEPQNTHTNGVGKRSVDFVTKGIGESTKIDIAILTLSGTKLDKQLIVIPIEVDVIWEANTYTPPFYQGRALPSNYSDITLMAIPNISNMDKMDFVYTWTEDRFNMIKSASGFKKNSMQTQAAESPLRKYIDIEINSIDTGIKAKQRVTIPTIDPEVIFYASSPLTGTNYTQAIGNSYTLRNSEILVRAEPFYLSQEAFNKKHVKYEWYFDNKKLSETNTNGLEFTFGKSKESGKATVRFKATNEDDWFQIAQNIFSIVY